MLHVVASIDAQPYAQDGQADTYAHEGQADKFFDFSFFTLQSSFLRWRSAVSLSWSLRSSFRGGAEPHLYVRRLRIRPVSRLNFNITFMSTRA